MLTPRDVHVDQVLTNLAIKYENAEFIADKIFKKVDVEKLSDKYAIFGDQVFEVIDDVRAPGTPPKMVEWKIAGYGQYSIEEHAQAKAIPFETLRNADKFIQENIDISELEKLSYKEAVERLKEEGDTVDFLMKRIRLTYEKIVADIVQNSSSYANGHSSSPSVKWDNYTNSNPIKDVEDAMYVVKNKIYVRPNTLVMSDYVYRVLKNHPKLLDMYKYTRGGSLKLEHLKDAFEVENILIGASGEKQAGSRSILWKNHVALLYISNTASKNQLSFGYTFRIEGYPYVEKIEDRFSSSIIIIARDAYDVRVVCPVAGYLLSNVVS